MSSPFSLAALAPVMKRIMVDTVQVFRPGPQILNEDTGVYEPGPDVIVWEGLGAVFAADGPGMVMSLAGQAYQDDTRDRYRLPTRWKRLWHPATTAYASRTPPRIKGY